MCLKSAYCVFVFRKYAKKHISRARSYKINIVILPRILEIDRFESRRDGLSTFDFYLK